MRERLAPLVLGRGDELIDDDLGAVGEVAELGLPEDERLGPLHAVAVVEAQHARTRRAGCRRPRSGPASDPASRAASSVSPVAVSWKTAWRWLERARGWSPGR